MLRAFIGLLSGIIFLHTYGQTTFQKFYGSGSNESYANIIGTSDGGYALFCMTGSNLMLIKVDAAGAIAWSKTYTGVGSYTRAGDIYQTSDDGFLLTGRANLGTGNQDMSVLKVTSTGTLSWMKRIDGGSYDGGRTVFELDDGNYTIAGRGCCGSNAIGSGHIPIQVFNGAGTTQFNRHIGNSGCPLNDHYADDIVPWGAGKIAMLATSGAPNCGTNGHQLVLFQLTNSVTVVAGSGMEYGGGQREWGSRLIATSDGGFLIGAYTESFGTGFDTGDVLMIKTDGTGAVTWAKHYGGAAMDNSPMTNPGNYRELFFEQMCDDEYLLASSTQSFGGGTNIMVIKIDGSGVVQWAKLLDHASNLLPGGVIQATTNEFVVGGTIASGPHGSGDMFLMQMNNTDGSTCAGTIPVSNLAGLSVTDVTGSMVAAAYTPPTTLAGSTITGQSPGTSDLGALNTSCSNSAGAQDCGTPLPVGLLYFQAVRQSQRVKILWSTATEVNNDHFTIMKSKDGGFFEALGKVDGAGNSNITQRYKFMDETPHSGINYYRLKQTDHDGLSTYSNTISVLFDIPTDLQVYPTITTGNVNIQSTYDISLEVFDIRGALISSEKITPDVIDISHLPAGVYFFRFVQQQTVITRRILKE